MRYGIEWLIIILIAALYSGGALLDFNSEQLQQTGEHNESATLPLLVEKSLSRYGEIPLWNPFMLTGFPNSADFINHFWNPVSTASIVAFGGINGTKFSIFISLVVAGIGQWWFAHVFRVRGVVRLWAGILFMISGGLALLWRAGWYELLLGAAWFPWCFASLWWALHRDDRASLLLPIVCIAMVLTTGGGYYPFYLSVTLAVLVGLAILFDRSSERRRKLQRAVAIAVVCGLLLAVMILPLIDGYRYVFREAGQDRQQRSSQPIHYALINYVVSKPEWFRAEILGTAGGWNWFYIGYLPLAALLFTPLAFSRVRWRRRAMAAVAVLTLAILAWHANRHTPVKHIYDWIPFLYNLRFPNRLLIVAASPLILLGGYGLQYLFRAARRWGTRYKIRLTIQGTSKSQPVSLRWVLNGVLVLILYLSVRDVYVVNKGFAFVPASRNAKATTALSWLNNHDPGLYYTQIGGGGIFWDWTPAAYELEMPIINFDYGRRLEYYDKQRDPSRPFFATPKYLLTRADEPAPSTAELVREFDGVNLWFMPDALPFAFSVQPSHLQSGEPLDKEDVSPQGVRLDGPNRVIVSGEPAQPGDQLIVLVSDFPGWRVSVDGERAELVTVNDYLGAAMLPGAHTYEFSFRPSKHYIGMGISLVTLAAVLGILWADSPWWPSPGQAGLARLRKPFVDPKKSIPKS